MIQIGNLQINLQQREIRQNGAMVRIGSRALDILEVLIQADGKLVSKDEIMRRVWPDMIVEENNLQVQVALLRKALGGDRMLIRTVPGRGYQLLTHRGADSGDADGERETARASVWRGMPAYVPALVGRDAAVAEIVALLGEGRVLTLVGAGGIGKTSLAIHIARRVGGQLRDGVRFIELAALSDPAPVLEAVARACDVPFAGGAVSAACIAEALAPQQCLIVLDNAEHVIDEVALLVSTLTAKDPQLQVLVTSREPLRLVGESIFRVHPLDVPAAGASSEQVLAHSAVQLFLGRARAMNRQLGSDAQSLRLAGELCRRLDGIPLAIELAAARAATLGIAGVYARLDNRLQLLTGGHRTALPRHQTLRATFDWSYALLDPISRTMFRRLGIFAGVFTFEAVCAVATDPELPIASVIGSVGELAGKSLLNVELDGAVARYRLSESTRAYAMDKLRDEGEVQQIGARHTRFLQRRFEEQLLTLDRLDERGAPTELRQTLDDARGAFDWAFSPEGDLGLGIELASALVGALLECSLVEECCTRATCAVAALERLPPDTVDATCEMRVRAALAATLLHTRGPVGRCAQLWHQVLALAVQAGDEEFQARALWGLWNTMLSCADIHGSFRFAIRFQQFAEAHGDDWQRILAGQLVAVSLHCFGEHTQAREQLERALAQLAALRYEVPQGGRFAVDPLIFSNGTLARIAWLQGFPDEALRLVEHTVNLVRVDTLEPSLSHVLAAVAVPIALMSGDLQAAARYLDVLRSQVAMHRFEMWHECCECLGGHLDILTGQVERGLPRLESALDALLARGFRRLLTPLIAVCAQTLVESGRIAEAAARLDEALIYCDAHGEQFFVPELWRVMGVAALAEARLARANATPPAIYEGRALRCFTTSIALARQHGARMWELRAALSLATFRSEQGHTDEALASLAPLAGHFDPASSASDIRALHGLLRELEHEVGDAHGGGLAHATGAVRDR